MQTNVMESECNGHPLSLLIDARGDFWLKTTETCVRLEQFHAAWRPKTPLTHIPCDALFLQCADVTEGV